MAKAKKARKETIQFRMDTRSFVVIWKNNLGHPKSNWNTFVAALWDRFSKDIPANAGNRAQLDKWHPKWQEWDAKGQYSFISERAYSKCISLRAKLLNLEVNLYEVDLPDGYLEREGSGSSRINIKEIAAIFRNA